MKSHELREAFVQYFKKNKHDYISSSSLIPFEDPTLLFTNAGMNQFKNVFLGHEKLNCLRAVTHQKCVRAGGKHNDLENVGFTARHHTFFEMLGNFSFGEYFKKEAIHFSWDFLTNQLGLSKDRLYVSVFETDDEAAEIWRKQEGVPQDRIFRFGEKDNFWRMGDIGPCGPSSEIFYDHGSKAGLIDDPYRNIVEGTDRVVEIWNLVFMQYYEKSPGEFINLPNPSIDTGAGLERISAVLQGQHNNYMTDCFYPLIEVVSQLTGVEIPTDFEADKNKRLKEVLASMRVLADHARAIAFLIADGVIPSNEGRGYVLRRILRRAIRYNRTLSDRLVLKNLINQVIELMKDPYKELNDRKEVILTSVEDEEKRFLQTLDQGTQILSEEFDRIKKKGERFIQGDVAFKLYDTYGFPVDLTELMAKEKNLEVNRIEFENCMNEAKKRSQASRKLEVKVHNDLLFKEFIDKIRSTSENTNFIGYDQLNSESRVLSLLINDRLTQKITQGESAFIAFDQTPFYAESGGQISDSGELIFSNGKGVIESCCKMDDFFIHEVHLKEGHLSVGDSVSLNVDVQKRKLIMRNHSATHLLHSALREVLGEHVTQAGSMVHFQRLRFDFTHNHPITSKQLKQIENKVNQKISEDIKIDVKKMSYDEAIKSGAMALFGEKYGDQVRVVKMNDYSTELCGGTHVERTSQIGLFKIVSDQGVSAGIRRIEALTSDWALQYVLQHVQEHQLSRAQAGGQESWMQFLGLDQSGGSRFYLPDWIDKTKERLKLLEKEIQTLRGKSIDVDVFIDNADQIKGVQGKMVKMTLVDVLFDDRKLLSDIADKVKSRLKSAVVLVVGKSEENENHPVVVAVTKDLVSIYSAGSIMKKFVQKLEGKGGGRPDFAQGSIHNRKDMDMAYRELLDSIKN